MLSWSRVTAFEEALFGDPVVSQDKDLVPTNTQTLLKHLLYSYGEVAKLLEVW
jgi:hypothetical protein